MLTNICKKWEFTGSQSWKFQGDVNLRLGLDQGLKQSHQLSVSQLCIPLCWQSGCPVAPDLYVILSAHLNLPRIPIRSIRGASHWPESEASSLWDCLCGLGDGRHSLARPESCIHPWTTVLGLLSSRPYELREGKGSFSPWKQRYLHLEERGCGRGRKKEQKLTVFLPIPLSLPSTSSNSCRTWILFLW